MTLNVLVTRPTAQAAEWVQRLRRHGIEAHALPLLAILPTTDEPSVRAAWSALSQFDLVMFVSPNAVHAFFAARPSTAAWPAGLRAAATGQGSVRALVDAGVPASLCVAPQRAPFDSAGLWALLRDEDWRDRRALIVRGDGGRDEFARALQGAGTAVTFVQCYRRIQPKWSTSERATAAAARIAPNEHVWLMSSSEAMGHLASLMPGTDWSKATALATHPRIAESARQFGFGRVLESSPQIDDELASLRYLQKSAS
jgi:uroporphyrinogen-III synthase